MLINYLFITLSGFFLGMFFIFILKRFILIHKKLNSKGIPLIGGIGMGLSFVSVSFVGSFLFQGLSKETIGIIASSIIMLVFGVIDDLKELSVIAKFLVQIIATSLLILFGIRTQIIYIGNIVNIIITFIWVIGVTNAFNHLDVIDGLAGSTAMIVSLAFFTVSLLNGDVRTVILTLALTGAIVSFLVYNLPPAKVYMGNAGSHFLGFILAAIALVISYAPLERKIALFSPILILGLPIYDTFFLMWIRVRKKRSIFKKSNDHLALRFLALGYSRRRVLLTMLTLCLFFSICGILVSQLSNLLGITIIASAILMTFVLTNKMSKVQI